MRPAIPMDEARLARRAVEALVKALGPVDTARFLALPVRKRIDSVRRHRDWQRHADKKELFDSVFGQDEDLKALRASKAEEADAPTISLAEARKELGLGKRPVASVRRR